MSNPLVPAPAPPEWLAGLANQLASRIDPVDQSAAVSCHFADGGEDGWEVTLFLAAREQIGGPRDGQRLFSRFLFELASTTELFDRVDQFYWQPVAIGPADEVGPHVAIEGEYDGRRVWVRILAQPGERFDTRD